jgi:hypothetical protein
MNFIRTITQEISQGTIQFTGKCNEQKNSSISKRLNADDPRQQILILLIFLGFPNMEFPTPCPMAYLPFLYYCHW